MIKSVKDLDKRLNDIQDEIINLKSDSLIEEIENNKYLEELLDELNEIKSVVKEILVDKYNEVIPSDENPILRDLFNESEQYRSIMKMTGKDSLFIERFGFDRTIYEVGNGTNVDQLNDSLKSFILDMDSIGIELDYTHFNYSVFSTKYMKVFFENLDSENYQIIMKKCFVNIYWECPQLLVHLEMCVRCLIYENKSIIVKHLNRLLNDNLKNLNITKNDLLPLYTKTKKKFMDLRDKDFYHIYSYFKTRRYKIDNYISEDYFYNILGRYMDVNQYKNFTEEERKFFMTNVRDLYNDLTELKMINKFRGLYDYFIKLYNNPPKDAAIKFKIARSDANKYEAIKNKLDRKLSLLIKKRDYLSGKNKESLNKVNEQIKELSAKVSNEIMAIKNEVDLVGDMRFYLDFMEDITATTTIYELTYFVSRYYGILSEIVKDKDLADEENIIPFVDEFRHIQYSPNLTIMNNVSFLNIDDINDLLERKYSMHGIKVNVVVDDKEILNIMSDLKYLMRWQNLKLIGISPEDIKILLLVDEKINALD